MGMDWPWQYSFPPFFTIQVSGPGHLFPPKQINCWQRLPHTAPQCNQSKTAGGLETSGSQLLSGGICCKFTRDENKDFQVHTISVLDLADAGDLPLFHNASISRRLPAEAILTVLEDLAQQWVDITSEIFLYSWLIVATWSGQTRANAEVTSSGSPLHSLAKRYISEDGT